MPEDYQSNRRRIVPIGQQLSEIPSTKDAPRFHIGYSAAE